MKTIKHFILVTRDGNETKNQAMVEVAGQQRLSAYDDIVLDDEKDVLVEFYISGVFKDNKGASNSQCSHCEKFKVTYEGLCER